MAKTLHEARNLSLNLVKQTSVPASPGAGRARLFVSGASEVGIVDESGSRYAVMQSGSAVLSTLTVSGASSLGQTTVSGVLTVTGNVAVGGTLHVPALATFGSMSVSEGLSVTNGLTVSGASALGGATTVTGSLSVNDSGGVSGLDTVYELNRDQPVFAAAKTYAGGFIDWTFKASRGTLDTPLALVAGEKLLRLNVLGANSDGAVISFAQLYFEAVQVGANRKGAFVVTVESNYQSQEVLRLSGRPTITGSRGGNAALTSLLDALVDMSLINDGTTA